MQKYKKMWDYFLSYESADFEKERKLTVKEIKRIGVRKFIQANDWRCIEDVKKWRTDVLEVVPCPHCRQDFGVLDDTLGLCNECIKLFDLKNFYLDTYRACGENPTKIGQALALFMGDKQLRKQYLIAKVE